MGARANERVELTWSPEFQVILDALNTQLKQDRLYTNVYLAARALLILLRDGNGELTNADVIDRVYRYDCPPGGWKNFDRIRWYAYVPAVVEQLRHDLPIHLAELKDGRRLYLWSPRR